MAPPVPAEAKHTPPARRTRRQLKRMNEAESEGEGEKANLFPLREVPTAPGIIGYVNVPINTSDVRAFKKEMGKLMDDPLGVSERLDEFLGTSIYSYEDLTAILRSLFNTEEREMIREAGIREWERRNPQSTPGDQKGPSQDPRWNAQTEEGRRNMIDMRNIIIQGIREAVPRGQNLREMLLVEEADYNLIGRDLIVALGINLIVRDSRIVVSIYKLTCEDEDKINPKVWHTGREAGRLDVTPISVEIKRPEDPIRIKQYPIPLEGRRGLKPIIEDLINKGILEPCMSRHNTPILAIKKTDGSYRLVQDLRAINERTKTRFPVVANPYTLLTRVSPEDTWYSVIDLKDAFWTCPLAEGSRDFFAFQWEDPDTNRKQQLRWASLPQGFVDSPNLFRQALEQLLSQFSPRKGTKILQYVDDLLVAGETEEDSSSQFGHGVSHDSSMVNIKPAFFSQGGTQASLLHEQEVQSLPVLQDDFRKRGDRSFQRGDGFFSSQSPTFAGERRVSPFKSQGDKFTIRATAAYPPPPIKLTWKSSDPVWVEQWPLSKPRIDTLLKLVDRELQKGHVEPSTSPWNTPVFVIPKRSGEGFRLLHDLREVNKKIQPMGPVQTSLPMSSMIPKGQPCAVLDIKDCFFSIPLHDEDKERFAFSIVFPNSQRPNLRFQWKVLPQGMVNSPTICQITVDRALEPVRRSDPTVTIVQYMDDILIAAPSASQVDRAVSTVSETLKTNGFEIASAKIKKGPCATFLGLEISSSYITPPQIKIHRDIETLHDMQQLVGSLQWLRNIVLIPPEVMDPLNDLLKGKNSWEQKTLTPEATRSLDFIEQQMSRSTLTRWDACASIDLYVHFTKKGGVGVLAQGPPDKAQPILWVVLGKPSRAFSPGVECLGNLIMKGRKLALKHLGAEPTKIYLPFRKQLSAQSTTISEHLAMALAGFGGEIRYAAKPPWTQLLAIFDIDLLPKIVDRPQPGPTIFTDASSLTSLQQQCGSQKSSGNASKQLTPRFQFNNSKQLPLYWRVDCSLKSTSTS
ncbi:hypothetical protein DUI87_01700 [Hirundo rustica rustica]|uniref:ribonuclease H n=1 Tax=Hirundo rustica rustica TaxID=333673 RepID=A0A3M0LP09_HIRRU|nr:hypothetical protein DUI87_01700 [Hirundo rustica rustica]